MATNNEASSLGGLSTSHPPDMFEGNTEVREAVCDHAGHDLEGLPMDMPGAFCVQCGAEWSADAVGQKDQPNA